MAFLGAYAVSRHASYCRYGTYADLLELPVEDARALAEDAWDQWRNIIGLVGATSDEDASR